MILIAGCSSPPVEDPFHDKGRGNWIEMPSAPLVVYHAVWGAHARDVLAVGKPSIAHFDGEVWRTIEGVPVTTYRAVWGRSSSEVWVGGDGALLARSLTGWQEQVLFDNDVAITDYSVLALGGDSLHEYAIVMTGGKLLLLINRGSSWETPAWRDGNGPTRPLPRWPSLFVHDRSLLVAGEGDLLDLHTTTETGFTAWEAIQWRYDLDLPPLWSIAGGSGFWVAVGGRYMVVQRDEDSEPDIISDERAAERPRDAVGIFAARANQLFVVGDPIELSRPDPISGVSVSPIEACDADGCALERVVPDAGKAALRAVWGDGQQTVIAVGDNLIVERRASCVDSRCL